MTGERAPAPSSPTVPSSPPAPSSPPVPSSPPALPALPASLGGPSPAAPPHPRWLAAHARELLDFCAAAADWPGGGFDGLTTAGQRQPGPKHLYATARMTYGFSLGVLLGRPGSEQLAQHGLEALRTIFHDDAHGGWFAELSPGGTEVTVASKQTYGHAFVLLASCAATAAGLAASDLTQEATLVFDRWLFDEQAALCVDAFDQAWDRPDSYRGINANMHAVEAFTMVYVTTGQLPSLRRAQAICGRLAEFAAAAQWRVPEHFTPAWEPLPGYNADRPGDGFRPFGSTPGHGLEWTRLLLQLRLAGGDPGDPSVPGDPSAPGNAGDPGRDGLLAAAQALFGRAVADAWDARRCGLAYTVDWQGQEVVSQRLHWPLAEAIGAARYLAAATGERAYADWYAAFWEVAGRCFIDREGGSWWHELDPDGTPASKIWPGKSDLYHALNATLLSLLPPAPSVTAALSRSRT